MHRPSHFLPPALCWLKYYCWRYSGARPHMRSTKHCWRSLVVLRGLVTCGCVQPADSTALKQHANDYGAEVLRDMAKIMAEAAEQQQQQGQQKERQRETGVGDGG